MTEENKKLEINSDPQDPSCATFILRDEDHTMGNALRYALMKNPKVDLAGYSVPHPSVSKMNLRVQTRDATAVECLSQGLKDITSMCQHILSTFESELERFQKEKEDGMGL